MEIGSGGCAAAAGLLLLFTAGGNGGIALRGVGGGGAVPATLAHVICLGLNELVNAVGSGD